MPSSEVKPEGKGARTRRRIMTETRAMMDEMSIDVISQQAVANRVGITQSALRHHFATKEALFDAIFDDAFGGFYVATEAVLQTADQNPRACLIQLCTMHLNHVARESDRVAIGSFAHHLYNDELLRRQTAWYHWIVERYATLLAAVRPDLDGQTVNARALAILTLSVGAWITVGKSRDAWPALSSAPPAAALLGTIESLIDA